jgi:putative dehydrogenase
MTNTVGVIGIGAMGMAIAKNLRRNGFEVAVRDVRAEAEREAAQSGMVVCPSPAAVAAQADLIVIVVLNAQQIEEVLFGEDGVTGEPSRGKTVLLCSTIAPQDTERFAQRLGQCGIAAIDGPISGGPGRAESGAMSMMLAAPHDVLARHEPVLATMSSRRFHLGDAIGDGARAKLVNNLLAGINLVAGAEALALGMRIGLDPHKLFDLIRESSGASWVFEDRMARALENDFAPRAFAHILTKDVTLATGMARDAGHPTPLGDAALAAFKETVARGWGELDDAAVIKTYLP